MPETLKRGRGRPKTDPKLDVWFGVEDARERKRIQDRLAQRARRDRLLGRGKDASKSGGVGSDERSQSSSNDGSASSEPVEELPKILTSSTPAALHINVSEPTLDDLPKMQIAASRRSSSPMTTDHHFIIWTAWPLWYALGQHALMQGTDCATGNKEALSPRKYLSLPGPLQPTPLQLVIPHTGWIDRLPFPPLRDNLILLKGLIDLDEFVRDLFGMASLLLRPNLQRPTWDPAGWIMGNEFSLKWGYLFL